MITERVEIDKEEYDRIASDSEGMRREAIAQIAIMSGYHPAGYSCSRPRVEEKDGKYYAVWERYSSCD